MDMKDKILKILRDESETFKTGSDGEYYTSFAVGEEDYDLVADKILLLLPVISCVHPFDEIVSGDEGDFCRECQKYLKTHRL